MDATHQHSLLSEDARIESRLGDVDESSAPSSPASSKWRRTIAPWLCVAIVLVLNLAFYAKRIPNLRLIESTVCREYYALHDPSMIGPGGSVDESKCKIDLVQKKVAWLSTASELLHFMTDFIAIVPLGVVADRLGSKPPMLLNFSGLILSWLWVVLVCLFYDTFSVNWILLGPLFCLPGGATHFNTAIIYTEASRHTTNWTTMFSLLEGIIQISQLVGPIVGSSLLFVDVWAPFYVIIPLAAISVPLALALPSKEQKETHTCDSPGHSRVNGEPDEQTTLLGHLADDNENPTGTARGGKPGHRNALHRYRSMSKVGHVTKSELKRFWDLFARHQIVRYAYAASFIMPLGKQALHILPQYASKRFGLAIAKVGYLFSLKAIVVLILYLCLLPAAASMWKVPKAVVDVRLIKTSIILLIVGTAVIGISWDILPLIFGLVFYAAGFGLPVLVRSLVSQAASHQHLPIPILFSGIAIAETLGSFVGAIGLTTAFTNTLGLRGWIQGLPFWICTLFYMAIAVPTWWLDLAGSAGNDPNPETPGHQPDA